MAEANETTTTTLPGGFESAEKMYAELQKVKDEAIANKTKAADLKALQDELAKLKDAEAQRVAAEQTDLEKAQARIVALEKTVADKEAAVLKAGRDMLLERELSKRLAAVPEPHRPLARMAYERAAESDYADEKALNSLLAPVDEQVKALTPTHTGVRSTMGGAPAPGGKPDPSITAATADLLKMDQGQIRRQLASKG